MAGMVSPGWEGCQLVKFEFLAFRAVKEKVAGRKAEEDALPL